MTPQKLFSPTTINGLSLDNRIVMAPMTREFSPGGVPGEDVAGYYRRRAEGEVGLIVTEGTTINDSVASMSDRIPRFHGEDALNGWKHVVDEVHRAGGKIFPQLWHVGSARNAKKSSNPDLPSASPSGFLVPGKQISEPMSVAHIEHIIAAFAEAAADAKRIGFDGVEFHGAHGYLIDQFFWEGLNQRKDSFGGNLAKRMQFAIEIIKAARSMVGPGYPIALRYSQWKQQDYTAKLASSPSELEQFLSPLVEAGVDCFHCSTRRYWEPEFENSDLNLAGWTKKITGKPCITVGSVGLDGDFMDAIATLESSETRGLDDLIDRLNKEEFEMVAVGRALLQDPLWAQKVRQGNIDEIHAYDGQAVKSLS